MNTSCAPRTLRAHQERPSKNGDALAPGTGVAASAVGVKVRLTGALWMGLSGGERSSLASTAYPLISRDDARSWRIDGPLFWRAAANAAAGAAAITRLGPTSVMVWAHAGNVVRVTNDDGAHWYDTDFACNGVESGSKQQGHPFIRSLGEQQPNGEFATYGYSSTDTGLTWRRISAMPSVSS